MRTPKEGLSFADILFEPSGDEPHCEIYDGLWEGTSQRNRRLHPLGWKRKAHDEE